MASLLGAWLLLGLPLGLGAQGVAGRLAEGHEFLAQGRLAEAEQVFELALKEVPHSAEAHYGLGLVFLKKRIGRYPAIQHFRQALRLDPTFKDAYYQLAAAFIQLGGWDPEREAKKALKALFRLEPTYKDAYARFLSLYLTRDDLEETVAILKEYLTLHPGDDQVTYLLLRTYLEMGGTESLKEITRGLEANSGYLATPLALAKARVAFEEGDTKAGTRWYLRGLEAVSTPQEVNLYYEDARWLLSEAEQKEFLGLSVEEQRRFLYRFWKERDPTPTTPENERLQEQQRRFLWASQYYRRRFPTAMRLFTVADVVPSAKRGVLFDDRGLVYLRHGEPEDRVAVSLSDRNTATSQESWLYHRGESRFFVHFRNDFTVGDFRLTEHADRDAYPYLSNFDPLYLRLAPRAAAGRPLDPLDVLQERQLVREAGVFAMRTDSYSFDYGAEPLVVDVYPVGFLGQAGTELEIALGIPPEETPAAPRATVVLFDEDWREVARKEGVALVALPPTSRPPEAPGWLSSLTLPAPPGRYHLATQVEDPARKIAVLKNEVTAEDLSLGLAVSDLLLASRAEAGEGPGIRRGGWTLLPQTSRRFEASQPLSLYFEIYGLRPLAGGKSRFRSAYTIMARSPRANVITALTSGLGRLVGIEQRERQITLSFEREADGPQAEEELTLDITRLKAGLYDLIMTVTDLQSGARVHRASWFEVR